MKKITSLIFLTLILSSCYWNINPNINWTPNTAPILNNIKEKDSIKIEKNISIRELNNVEKEIKDRQEWFIKLNKEKEYLLAVKSNLDGNISSFKWYIEVSRQLLLADLKIVDAIVKWYLKESSINKNNYYYTYLKENKKNKTEILKDLPWLIKILSNKKIFNKYYFNNLDLWQAQTLDLTSKKVFFYINYYLYKSKYNNEVASMLSNIIDNYKKLKIKKYPIELTTSSWFFSTKSKNYIYIDTIKDLYKSIK